MAAAEKKGKGPTPRHSVRKGGGPPPEKLTPQLQQIIIDNLATGAYIETAACLAGIARTTFYEWIKKGNKEKSGKYYDFVNAVNAAVAKSEMRDLGFIDNAAKDGQWQAAAWKLERRHPDKWGKRERHELTGADGGPIEHKDASQARQRLVSKLISVTTDESKAGDT